jgi:DNA-binding HxlR family transcriptional regulator
MPDIAQLKPIERLAVFSLRAKAHQTAAELMRDVGVKTPTYLQSALRTLYLAGIVDHQVIDGEVRYSLAAVPTNNFPWRLLPLS